MPRGSGPLLIRLGLDSRCARQGFSSHETWDLWGFFYPLLGGDYLPDQHELRFATTSQRRIWASQLQDAWTQDGCQTNTLQPSLRRCTSARLDDSRDRASLSRFREPALQVQAVVFVCVFVRLRLCGLRRLHASVSASPVAMIP